jgi:hypothetical protein
MAVAETMCCCDGALLFSRFTQLEQHEYGDQHEDDNR